MGPASRVLGESPRAAGRGAELACGAVDGRRRPWGARALEAQQAFLVPGVCPAKATAARALGFQGGSGFVCVLKDASWRSGRWQRVVSSEFVAGGRLHCSQSPGPSRGLGGCDAHPAFLGAGEGGAVAPGVVGSGRPVPGPPRVLCLDSSGHASRLQGGVWPAAPRRGRLPQASACVVSAIQLARRRERFQQVPLPLPTLQRPVCPAPAPWEDRRARAPSGPAAAPGLWVTAWASLWPAAAPSALVGAAPPPPGRTVFLPPLLGAKPSREL